MKKNTFIIVVLIFFIFLLLLACQKGNIIKIGVSVTLSGRNSPMGIAVKDGAVLAVEEINADGGINGKMLELIIKDDQNDPDTARKVDAELINEGVVTIIGHITSAMTEAALEQANEKQMLLLSPTTSSFKLLDMDNNLISIYPPNIYEQELLAKYAITHSTTKTISIIYDMDNSAFSTQWASFFTEYYDGVGGSVDAALPFNSSDEKDDLFRTIDKLLEKRPKTVLIVASAIDTARVCQQIEKKCPVQVLKLSSLWGLDNTLIEQGGKSVDGLVLPNSWDKDSNAPGYLKFLSAFTKRYKREPQFAETYGYEAVLILSETLKSGTASEPMKIKDKILAIGEFQGLQGKITIDEKGKTKRDEFLFIVEDNTFKRITE